MGEASLGGVARLSCNLGRGGSDVLTVDISLPDVEELHKLVAEGREKGFLSYDEIATASRTST